MTGRVSIVGGGIAGLTAAFDLHRAGWDVIVHEASDRWGGKIWSSPVGDRMVDAGPDTFLARVPEGKQLCDDLGIAGGLVSPVAPVPAYFHRDGRLVPLASGTVLGVPTDLDALAASGAVSAEAVARAADDLTLPATELYDADGTELSVGAYCRERLGDEVTERLIDPLIGGINASDIDRLSLETGAPQLWTAANRSPSIIEGLRALRPQVGATLGSAGVNEPVFLSLPGGISQMIDALVDHLEGADLRLESPVDDLDQLDADHVIIATPTGVASELLAGRSPRAAEGLATIEYASVAQVTVEIPKDGVDRILDASGILFPRVDGTMITASTWFSTKWAHYDRPDSVLIRLTSGRFGDTRSMELDDEALVSTLMGELSAVVPITADPIAVRIHRWVDALPQYTPGHRRRVDDIMGAVADDAPTVHLVGNPYRGIGIPVCIGGARDVAASLIAS